MVWIRLVDYAIHNSWKIFGSNLHVGVWGYHESWWHWSHARSDDLIATEASLGGTIIPDSSVDYMVKCSATSTGTLSTAWNVMRKRSFKVDWYHLVRLSPYVFRFDLISLCWPSWIGEKILMELWDRALPLHICYVSKKISSISLRVCFPVKIGMFRWKWMLLREVVVFILTSSN